MDKAMILAIAGVKQAASEEKEADGGGGGADAAIFYILCSTQLASRGGYLLLHSIVLWLLAYLAYDL